jgi:DNA-binding MarR family transcriptional regulator
MTSDPPHTPETPLIALLSVALDNFSRDVYARVETSKFDDLRTGHACVFSNIDPDGSRLTDLAERARMTKQSVGEVASDLEKRGYVERAPDPDDGRAKIIRLTERGHLAQTFGRGVVDEVERDWAERYGEERMAALRDALEVITAEWFGAVPA